MGTAQVYGAVVVNIGRAHDETLHCGHQRIEAEGITIMEIYANEPCRPAIQHHSSCIPILTSCCLPQWSRKSCAQ